MPTQIDERMQGGTPREEENKSAAASNPEHSLIEAPSETSALAASAHFLRDGWLRVTAISIAVLIPCFWHRRIEAGDLASHTYNAWLAELIERGQAPGLWLAKQWNNVLFDVSLSRLERLVGLSEAEKICVSAAVLIFFWGAFALIGAIARRAPWSLVPCIAMFAYGWTLQQGFLNYYISVGFAFFGIALLHRGKGLERALVLLILPLTWMAHPLGAALLLGLGSYVAIAGKLNQRRQSMLLAGAGILMVAATAFVASHYSVVWSDDGYLQALFTFTGADQLSLYGSRYRLPSIFLFIFAVSCLVRDIYSGRKREEPWPIYSLPLQLYGLALLAAILLPVAVTLPAFGAPLSMLAPRLTSATAVLACGLLGLCKPEKWHFPCLAAIAVVFFLFLYGDTGRLNKMEEQAERYERALPPGQRIIATIWPFEGSRLLINHIVDRACIGQCFSYGNYEPSSGQFRVRVRGENPVVLATPESSDEVQSGNYIVRDRDLPIFQIYQCNLNLTELCMRELAAGERNGSMGVQPIVDPKRAAAAQVPVR